MIDFSALSVRDYILIAATLVGGYLVLSLLPLLRMGRKHRRSGAPMRSEGGYPAGSGSLGQSDSFREVQHQEPQSAPPGGQPQPLTGESNSASPPVFSRELAYSSLDLEVKRMRCDVDEMRAEMVRMVEEMRRLKATRNVSPIYSEAMILAQQGEAPAGIAAQCGISIGEAELVAALARSGTGAEFDDKDDDRYTDAGLLRGKPTGK
ncbi:MAG: DUF2802 domain-containing protein [Sulfuritalea sp.]|nr:DUF2802 domain-containing protein [Sulfuritalea sp.]